MRRIAIVSLAMTTPALLVAGCGGRTPRPPAPAVISPSVVPLAAAAYVAMASSIDLFEIQSAELALQRSRDAGNRTLAEMLIRAHKGTSAQLSFAGRRLNLLPSSTLLPQHQAMLDELAASSDFDAAFRRQQWQVHQSALDLHGAYARAGDSATLRPVAANAARVVRGHLSHLRSRCAAGCRLRAAVARRLQYHRTASGLPHRPVGRAACRPGPRGRARPGGI